MASAAQAAAGAMRASRNAMASQAPTDKPSVDGKQAESKPGGFATLGGAYKQLPDAKAGKATEWGKLSRKVAEELNQGQHEEVSGDYRTQIETYYRVIAEKSKK